MAWIESHESLPGHPKTKRICRFLQLTPVVAVGHLHFLWWWAMNHAQDGVLDRYSAEDIADACSWDGDAYQFFTALVESGFVDETNTGHSIHDWHDYAGKLIALRQKDAERKRNSRGKKEEFEESPADIQRTSDGHPEDSDGNLSESIRNPNPNPNPNPYKNTSRPKRVYDEQSIPYRLAKYLLTKILEFKPDLKKPNLQSWADDMRKLVELDDRDPKHIGQVIDWVTKDTFWHAVILSAANLRDKWDKITALMQNDGVKQSHKNIVQFTPSPLTDKEREDLAEITRRQAERNGVQTAINK